MQGCRHETVGSELGGHRHFCGSSAQENSIETVCKRGEVQRALSASQLFSAMRPLEAVKVSIMMSVSWSNKGKPLKLRHYDISRAHFQGTAQRLIYIRLPAEDRLTRGEDKVGRLFKRMYGTRDASHIWQLDYENLICGELTFEEANTVQHCFTIRTKMWGWQCTATTLRVCQTMIDSNTSIVVSNPNTQQNTWEHLDSEIQK